MRSDVANRLRPQRRSGSSAFSSNAQFWYSRTSVPRHKFCTIGVKTRECLWGQSFRFAAGLLPGVGIVQDVALSRAGDTKVIERAVRCAAFRTRSSY